MMTSNLHNKYTYRCQSDLTRERVVIDNSTMNELIINGYKCINFSSNDYLGLAQHPKVMAAFIHGINEYGFGSGSSSMVAGFYKVQQELENSFASWLQVDKAILFNSGYMANLGVIASLVGRRHVVLADKLCHASIIDGARLSRAKLYRYKHNSLQSLKLLVKTRQPDLIISESIFSMEGDISPLKEIMCISKKNQVGVMIDDAHGIGVLGEGGRGICEYANLQQDDYSCLIAPLGKAFNGIGAIVAGRKDVIESTLQFARTYWYTTALPPATCSALAIALEIISNQHWRRKKLNELICLFNDHAKARGLKLVSTDQTPIRSIIIGKSRDVIRLQKIMLLRGYSVSAIRPPTVPINSARIRISISCNHTKQQIFELIDCIASNYLYVSRLGTNKEVLR